MCRLAWFLSVTALSGCLAPRLELRARAVRADGSQSSGRGGARWGVVFMASLGLLASWPAGSRAQEMGPPTPALPVQRVVELALRAQARGALRRADRLYRQARLSGLVPKLRLAARRGQQQDLSATSTPQLDRTARSTDDELSLEASLVFELDRLVFAPEQVRLLRLRRGLEADRRQLVERVVALYFEYERRCLERATLGRPDAELELAIAELRALLDAYTDGQFSDARVAARREPSRRTRGALPTRPVRKEPRP